MRMKIFGACAAATLLAGASVAAQDPDMVAMKQAMEKQAVEKMALARVPLEAVTKGAPYSAETLVESSQQLADGNRISRKTAGRVYRDTEGRTRREEDREDGTTVISIVDPVAGVSYRLEPSEHIAWKTSTAVGATIMNKMAADEKMAVELQRSAGARGREGGFAGAGAPVARGGVMIKAPEPTVEQRTIEGVPAECRNVSTTLPPGAIGNERAITITSEQCTSPDLKVLVLTKHSDPRSGESSYRLTNIVRAEPDPSLFLVPPGYTIKDTGIRRPEPRR